jgi:hypothetical protein
MKHNEGGSIVTYAKLRTAVVACTVLALGALVIPPASAGVEICTAGECSGSAEFDPPGEIFTVHDYNYDYHGVVGYLWKYSGGSWQRVSPAGGLYNGNGAAGAPEERNYSIAEGTYVKYEACLVDGANGTPFRCSGWYYTYA